MAEDSAARRARDSALLVKAASYNGAGIAALDLAVPLLMADLRSQDAERRRTAHSATEGPWLFAVRDMAREHAITPAQQAFKRADACYWALVMHWSPMIHRKAKHDEIKYRLPIGELRGMYSEIAFHVAVRLDLERSAFGTYFNAWRRSFINRAPELQTLVHGCVSEKGLNARMAVQSFDEPAPENWPKAKKNLEESLAVADRGFDDLDLHAAMNRINSQLNGRERDLFRIFAEFDMNTDASRVLGVSRERARQLRNAVIAKGTAIVYERVSP